MARLWRRRATTHSGQEAQKILIEPMASHARSPALIGDLLACAADMGQGAQGEPQVPVRLCAEAAAVPFLDVW